MGWSEFYAQATHGVVDLAMGRGAGITENRVRRRAATDGWQGLHPGAWRLATHPDSPTSRLAAALRLAGPEARADRHTALALRGLVSAWPTRHQLLLPHGCRVRPNPEIDVRRTRTLHHDEHEEVDGLPSLCVARVLLDLARDLQAPALRSLALAALRDGHLEVEELRTVLARNPCAPGRRRLERALVELDRDGSESGFEFTTRDRVVAAGLAPDPEQPSVLVGGVRRRIDIAWVALRVGLECQGYRAHARNDALDRDAARMNALVADGDWIVLQVTATILHEGWERFLAELCRCLRRRADALGLPRPPGSELH